MSIKPLPPKHELFAREYVNNGLDAGAAWGKVFGVDPKRSSSIRAGDNLANTAAVAHRISVLLETTLTNISFGPKQLISELARIATGEITDIVSIAEGQVCIKDTARLSANTKRLIGGIKEGKYGIEVTARNQDAALRLLAQIYGLVGGKLGGETEVIPDTPKLPTDPVDAARVYAEFIQS